MDGEPTVEAETTPGTGTVEVSEEQTTATNEPEIKGL